MYVGATKTHTWNYLYNSSRNYISLFGGENMSCDGEQQEFYLVQEAKHQEEEERPAKRLKIYSDMHDTAANEKIPRPPNAFIIFGKEWRKKVATEYPLERNTSISKRLGDMWNSMSKEDKEIYFENARKQAAEHRIKYPDYEYNPKLARQRKAERQQRRRGCRTATTMKAGVPSTLDEIPRMLDMIPASAANSEEPNTQSSMQEITGSPSDSCNFAKEAEDIKGPFPAFKKEFDSTEFDHCHEGLFNSTEQTNNQQPTNNEVSISSAPDYNYYMGPTQIPTFESTMHYHQNQLHTVNQYSRFYNYYNYNYNEFHQHFN